MEAAETPPVPPAAPAPGGPGLFGSWLPTIGIFSLAALLCGAASVPLLFSDPARLAGFAERSMPNLRADITIGSVRIGWVGPIVIESVRMVPRDGGESPLRIARIEGSHGLAAILLSWGDLGLLSLQGVEGHLAFDQDRRSNLGTLFAARSETMTADRSPRPSPVRVRLKIEDLVLRITGPWTAEPWVGEPISISARLAAAADGTRSEWTIEPVDVFNHARLEPAVAQGVLKYAAPVLAGAATTSGRFSLRLDGARFPVGDPENATLSGTLSMHEVVLGPGPLILDLLDRLPRLPQPPEIPIADESNIAFRLEKRRVWHEGLEFGIPLAKPGQRLDLATSGWVNLADETLDLSLRLPIPADLPQDRPLLASLAGRSVSVGVEGPIGAPKVVFDGSLRATAGEVVADLIERFRTNPTRQPGLFPGPDAESIPRAGGDAPAGAGSQTGDVIEIVGGILDEVARRRAERRAAAEEDPTAEPPPRRGGGLLRGRLRRSLGGPPDIPPGNDPPLGNDPPGKAP